MVGVAAAGVVEDGNKKLPVVVAAVAVVAVPKTNPPPVTPVPVVPAAPEPIVPVHKAPLGQHATWLAASGVQMLLAMQQTFGWPRLLQPV